METFWSVKCKKRKFKFLIGSKMKRRQNGNKSEQVCKNEYPITQKFLIKNRVTWQTKLQRSTTTLPDICFKLTNDRPVVKPFEGFADNIFQPLVIGTSESRVKYVSKYRYIFRVFFLVFLKYVLYFKVQLWRLWRLRSLWKTYLKKRTSKTYLKTDSSIPNKSTKKVEYNQKSISFRFEVPAAIKKLV